MTGTKWGYFCVEQRGVSVTGVELPCSRSQQCESLTVLFFNPKKMEKTSNIVMHVEFQTVYIEFQTSFKSGLSFCPLPFLKGEGTRSIPDKS